MQVKREKWRENIIFFSFFFFFFFFYFIGQLWEFLKNKCFVLHFVYQKEEQKLKIYKEQRQREMKENLKQGDKVSRC